LSARWTRWWAAGLIAAAGLGAGELRAEEPVVVADTPPGGLLVEPSEGEKPYTVWDALIWYVPNRVMDVVDIFRLRVKVGPGFGVTARLTDYAAFYAGSQSTVYLGLPGPRYPGPLRSPVGYENQRGLVVAGVDASDVVDHPPHYGFSEVDVGLHLGLVGVEAGIDPFELADFLAGWFLLDLRGDDIPRRSKERPGRGRVVAHTLTLDREGEPKPPEAFSSTTERLDYLELQVPRRLQKEMSAIDERFAGEGQEVLVQPPMEDLSIGLYVRTIVGARTEVEFKPDINLDVDLPNLERRVSLFVESASSDDLPGRDKLDRSSDGFSVGARSKKNPWDISTDVGVRAKWLPEVFTRAAWKPEWSLGEWQMNFEQRVFWESDDGFGTLTTLGAHRWFARDRWIYRQNTSGTISEETDGYEWEQSIAVGRVYLLFDEQRRRLHRRISSGDALSGYGVRASVFGSDDQANQVKLLATYRFALYKRFVIADLRAGPQWREVEDWDPEARLDFGIELKF
jgi:hypothetical protein